MSKSESGAQLLARLGARQSVDALEPHLFEIPLHGQVIQFSGTEGTGKSEILLHLLARCILPQDWKTFKLGGFGVRVVFIDCDYKFSVLRLALILEKRIIRAVETAAESAKAGNCSFSSEDVESLIRDCLKNLYLIHCSSSQHLLCTVHSLENIFSTEPEISCFMIDSMSAFYWADCCGSGNNTAGQEKVMNSIVKSLEKIVKDYNLVLLVTKAEIFRNRVKNCNRHNNFENLDEKLIGGYSEFLGKDWANFVDQLFLLTKTSGDKVTYSVMHKTWKCSKKFQISDYGVEFL